MNTKYPGIKHTALIGSKEFRKPNVKSRVINSRPYRLYCRSGSIDLPSELKDRKLEFLSSKEQLNFQSRFYKFGVFDILLEKFFYETSFFELIKHTYACLTYRGFWGVATGFMFSLALYEHPDVKIIVSGIGLVEGVIFTHLKTHTVMFVKPKIDKEGKKIFTK